MAEREAKRVGRPLIEAEWLNEEWLTGDASGVNGFCSSPGHENEPGRLYPCGWRCDQCAPGPRLTQDSKQRGEDR